MVCTPTHALQFHQQISEVTEPKFIKIFTVCTGFIVVKDFHPLHNPPNSCQMPAHRMKTGVSIFPDVPQIGYPQQRSLSKPSQIRNLNILLCYTNRKRAGQSIKYQ